MRVYCFGNEFVEGDGLAKEIADELKIRGVEFVKCDSVDELDCGLGDSGIILDVAKGIKKIEIVKDMDRLKSIQPSSAHDLDLAFFLKLYQSMGKLRNVKVICLPIGMSKEAAKKELKKLLPDNV